jgi:hypothetical protein
MVEVETVSVADEDSQAKELLAKWDAEYGDDDSVETGETPTGDVSAGIDGYDEELEKYRRTVHPKDNEIDHVILGCTDLDAAMEDFEKVTGTKPVMVVSLNGLGTKSARIAFESCCFIEIVGPDPKQTCTSALKESLEKLPPGKTVPIGYAVRHSRASDMKDEEFKKLGFECDQVTMVAKDRGMPWKWDMIFLEGHGDGGLVPYYVNWGEAHHAAGRLPIVGTLDSVIVRAPSSHKLHELLDDVRGIKMDTGDAFFEFTFTTSKGTLSFSGSNLVGVTFPKEGGLPVKEGSR